MTPLTSLAIVHHAAARRRRDTAWPDEIGELFIRNGPSAGPRVLSIERNNLDARRGCVEKSVPQSRVRATRGTEEPLDDG